MSVFIIAEAGVNHNGSIHLAKKLIDIASNAGADAVKVNYLPASLNLSKQLQLLGTKLRIPRYDFIFKPHDWMPDADGKVAKQTLRSGHWSCHQACYSASDAKQFQHTCRRCRHCAVPSGHRPAASERDHQEET